MYFGNDGGALDRALSESARPQHTHQHNNMRPNTPGQLDHQNPNALKSMVHVFGFDEDDTDETVRQQCWHRLKDAWADEDSFFRRMLVPFILFFYSFIGGAIFYGIEQHYLKFWECVFYVNTLFTTIGYGTIHPYTTGGKIFTMFYSIIGLPLAIVSIGDIGFLLAKYLGDGWRSLRRVTKPCRQQIKDKFQLTKKSVSTWRRGNSVVPTEKTEVVLDHHAAMEKKKKKLLPFSIALFTCIGWLMIVSAYFFALESSWTFLDAFYYVFISVATIGLGDLNSSSSTSARTIVDFFFILIGIALFSMCLNVVQYEMEHISLSIAETINAEYQQALQNGQSMPLEAQEKPNTKSGRHRIDHMEERKKEEEAARHIIRQLIHKKAGWLRFLVGPAMEDRLLSEYMKHAKMRLASTQTDPNTRDVSIMVQPVMCDKFVATREFLSYHQELHRLTTELGVREREAIQKHIKRISDRYAMLVREIMARKEAKSRASEAKSQASSKSDPAQSTNLGSIDETRSNDINLSLDNSSKQSGSDGKSADPTPKWIEIATVFPEKKSGKKRKQQLSDVVPLLQQEHPEWKYTYRISGKPTTKDQRLPRSSISRKSKAMSFKKKHSVSEGSNSQGTQYSDKQSLISSKFKGQSASKSALNAKVKSRSLQKRYLASKKSSRDPKPSEMAAERPEKGISKTSDQPLPMPDISPSSSRSVIPIEKDVVATENHRIDTENLVAPAVSEISMAPVAMYDIHSATADFDPGGISAKTRDGSRINQFSQIV